MEEQGEVVILNNLSETQFEFAVIQNVILRHHYERHQNTEKKLALQINDLK